MILCIKSEGCSAVHLHECWLVLAETREATVRPRSNPSVVSPSVPEVRPAHACSADGVRAASGPPSTQHRRPRTLQLVTRDLRRRGIDVGRVAAQPDNSLPLPLADGAWARHVM